MRFRIKQNSKSLEFRRPRSSLSLSLFNSISAEHLPPPSVVSSWAWALPHFLSLINARRHQLTFSFLTSSNSWQWPPRRSGLPPGGPRSEGLTLATGVPRLTVVQGASAGSLTAFRLRRRRSRIGGGNLLIRSEVRGFRRSASMISPLSCSRRAILEREGGRRKLRIRQRVAGEGGRRRSVGQGLVNCGIQLIGVEFLMRVRGGEGRFRLFVAKLAITR